MHCGGADYSNSRPSPTSARQSARAPAARQRSRARPCVVDADSATPSTACGFSRYRIDRGTTVKNRPVGVHPPAARCAAHLRAAVDSQVLAVSGFVSSRTTLGLSVQVRRLAWWAGISRGATTRSKSNRSLQRKRTGRTGRVGETVRIALRGIRRACPSGQAENV